MDDLARWLGAQLDADEAAARGCSGTDWWEHPKNWVSAPPLNRVAVVLHDGDRAHILRHDPARVLRETDAKRKLVNLHGPVRNVQPDGITNLDCSTCGGEDRLSPSWPCLTIRLIALPYADREGYQEGWAP